MTQREQRIAAEFEELARIDSVSFEERRMADRLMEKLKELGVSVKEDAAGSRIGGLAGNVCGFLKGTLSGPPILFSAHMDTVEPGKGKHPIVTAGRIESDKTTVLGADDLAGIVEILEGLRLLQEQKRPHRDLELRFTAAEEAYGIGAARLDYEEIRAKEAYVLDLSGDVGTAALQAPTILSFTLTIKGKAAHAGFAPEKGVHAIQVMGEVLGRMRLGRVREDTTVNVGEICGGTATNIVPDTCSCRGEIRSYDHRQALKELEGIRALAGEIAMQRKGTVELESTVHLKAYHVKETDPAVARFRRACENLGLDGNCISTFGGSDNNHFVHRGISGIVLSCGMNQVHSVDEYTSLEQIEKGAELVAELASLAEGNTKEKEKARE